ncbi:MAG: hypothetical protein ACI4FZ_01620 [Lachnospiraceae bacterium]
MNKVRGIVAAVDERTGFPGKQLTGIGQCNAVCGACKQGGRFIIGIGESGRPFPIGTSSWSILKQQSASCAIISQYWQVI